MAARASLILALLHSLLSLAAAQQTGACPAGKFGGACQHTCHCSNPASCDPGTGVCDSGECQSDYTGPFCQKYNVARQGSVTAVGGWNSPTLATDGSPGDSTTATCFHSTEDLSVLPGWWRVDLGAVFPMDDIRIWFWQAHNVQRSSGLAINILNGTNVEAHCTTVQEGYLRSKDFSCPQWGQTLELRKTSTAPVQTITLCEVQVFACVDKTYGSTCTPCGQCKGGAACDRTDGTCPAGCDPGWSGSGCVTAASICPDNTYGPQCTPCGQCQGGAACASTDGSCPAGCDPGWNGQRCDTTCSSNCLQGTCAQQTGACTGCQAGWWGVTCNATCSSNCLQGTCAQQNGSCTGGCQPGWWGVTCNTQCGDGTYGADCSLTCGECASPPCHHVNGTCFGGCQPGKSGELCRADCPAGFYGVGCTSRCGKCQDSSCLADGRCPGLCQPGWRGDTCNEKCSAGQFGLNCNNTCGSCRDTASCDHVTGDCPAGCKAGWEEPRCLQECSDGTYGEGCTMQCGKCAGGEACNKKDGRCRGACEEGFEGCLCQPVRQSMSYNQGMGTGIGIGLGVACLLFVPALIGTVLFFRRRLRSQRPTQSTDPTVYYNTAQAQAESEDKGPYESLEAATRNANVPSDYEEIRGNRRR